MNGVKLSTLNPQFWAIGQMAFDCPQCGVPHRIIINVHGGQPNDLTRTWNWNYGGGVMDWESLTLQPSIRNAMHGRKKSCGWHGNVTNGEVTNA